MKIVADEKKIQRNSRIGQITSLAGFVILLGGMYFVFGDPNQVNLILVALLAGFILSQVGMYYSNRWGRRPDKAIDLALKGLDDRYAIYHYAAPAQHVLVGPAGVWVILPYFQLGKITYEKNRWKQRGGGFIQSYLRFFGQESIGRPDLDVAHDLEVLKEFLAKKLPETELPSIEAVLVFLSDKAQIEAENAPTPTMLGKDLKEYLRKTTKGKVLTSEKARPIQVALGDKG
jgi:hypothetical protein